MIDDWIERHTGVHESPAKAGIKRLGMFEETRDRDEVEFVDPACERCVHAGVECFWLFERKAGGESSQYVT